MSKLDSVVRELLTQEMVGMLREDNGPLRPTNETLARVIVDRLDPDSRAKPLLRLAAMQQIAYQLDRIEVEK